MAGDRLPPGLYKSLLERKLSPELDNSAVIADPKQSFGIDKHLLKMPGQKNPIRYP